MPPLPFALVMCLTALAATPAFAQPATDAGALQNQQQNQEKRFPDRLPETERQTVHPALKEADSIKVLIKGVRFSGALHLTTEEELQAVVADAVGRELDFSGIEQITSWVTDFLKGKGWFLARAYLPRQDITDGVLEIILLEGRLDSGRGNGRAFTIVFDDKVPPRINPKHLEAIAARYLPTGATAREKDIERALLLMKDLPGISARASLEAGSEADSTRIAIAAQEGSLFTGSVWLDNYGNRDTGEAQANVALRLNDPLGIGDQAGFSGTHTEGIDLVGMTYTLPLGSQGLKLNAAVSGIRYEIIRGLGRDAGLKGGANIAGLTLSYPFIRTRVINFYGSFGYTAKALKDDSLAGNLRDKRLGNWSTGLSGDLLDTYGGGGITSANLNWTSGRLDLSANAADAAIDSLTYRSRGAFNKFVYGLGRLQKLPGAFTLFARFSGQATQGNLDSAEKFILGGPYGVRAYSTSEAMGDSGWLANLELRYDLPGGTPLGNLQLAAFADTGHITLHDDPKDIPIATATDRNSYPLSGWGIGMNLTKTGSHAVRLGWAGKIGDNPGRSVGGLDADSRNDKSRVWLQASLWF